MMTEVWPALSHDQWKDTYATLPIWPQVGGKVALAEAAPINHSCGIALAVTPRGLSTALLPHGHRSFSIAFDFVGHVLAIETCDGDRRVLPLEPRSVAEV